MAQRWTFDDDDELDLEDEQDELEFDDDDELDLEDDDDELDLEDDDFDLGDLE